MCALIAMQARIQGIAARHYECVRMNPNANKRANTACACTLVHMCVGVCVLYILYFDMKYQNEFSKTFICLDLGLQWGSIEPRANVDH
jgi:hypothetical protein